MSHEYHAGQNFSNNLEQKLPRPSLAGLKEDSLQKDKEANGNAKIEERSKTANNLISAQDRANLQLHSSGNARNFGKR